MDFSGEEAFGFRFPFPGKVRLGSVRALRLVEHLVEEVVGFSLPSPPLDRDIVKTARTQPPVGFPFPVKVRLGSVQDQSAGLVDHLGEEAVGFLLPSFPDKGMTSLVDFLGKEAVG